MRNISILTNQLTADAALETWFIQNTLLGGLSFGLDWEADNFSNQVVIYLELGLIDHALIARLKSRGNKVVLCQMGDEFKEKADPGAYAECDLILRNYYFPEIDLDPRWKDRMMWIPNGFKSGVGPRDPSGLRPADRRRFLACFLGWLDNGKSFGNERAAFREIAQQASQDILLQPTAYFGKGYNVGMYSAVMEYAVFCPCPAGNSPETIRLYDALELGAIPLSLGHEFLANSRALGDAPFPQIRDWAELPALLSTYRQQMMTDPAPIISLQRACIQWWSAKKRSLASEIEKRLFALRIQP